MTRVNQYTVFSDYDEFLNYWINLPAQKNAGITMTINKVFKYTLHYSQKIL